MLPLWLPRDLAARTSSLAISTPSPIPWKVGRRVVLLHAVSSRGGIRVRWFRFCFCCCFWRSEDRLFGPEGGGEIAMDGSCKPNEIDYFLVASDC